MNETGRAPLFQIVDWNLKYENDRSRVVENCHWMCVQNDLLEPAVLELFDHPLGVYCHSIFLRMLCLCSRQKKPREGWLTHSGQRDSVPYSVDRLARVFRVDPVLVKVTIHACMASEVGWLACVSDSPEWLNNGAALLVESLTTAGREIANALLPYHSRPDNGELRSASNDSLLSQTNSTISAPAPALVTSNPRQGHLEGKGNEGKRNESLSISKAAIETEIQKVRSARTTLRLGDLTAAAPTTPGSWTAAAKRTAAKLWGGRELPARMTDLPASDLHKLKHQMFHDLLRRERENSCRL